MKVQTLFLSENRGCGSHAHELSTLPTPPDKQKEVEQVANPIMRELYQSAGGGGGAGGMDDEDEDYDFGDDEL